MGSSRSKNRLLAVRNHATFPPFTRETVHPLGAEQCHPRLCCRVQEDCKGALAMAGDNSRMQHAVLQDRVNTLQGGVDQLQREKALTDEAVSAAAGDAVKCAVALDKLAEKVSRPVVERLQPVSATDVGEQAQASTLLTSCGTGQAGRQFRDSMLSWLVKSLSWLWTGPLTWHEWWPCSSMLWQQSC